MNFRVGASIVWYCIIGLIYNGLCSICEYYLILLDILGENIFCIEKSDLVILKDVIMMRDYVGYEKGSLLY